MRFDRLSLALMGLMVALLAPAGAQDTLKVSAPQRGAWDTAVVELGQRAGIFRRHGIMLEILWTSGGAESQQAVISGSLDIAVGVGIDGAIGAFARGAPLRIIGSEMTGSPDLYWYVVPGSPVKTVKDFAGKTVAYSVTGSSSHSALLGLLKQYEIAATPIATGGMPATLTQTMSGQVDIGWGAAPFGLDQLERGQFRIVARGPDVASRADKTVRVNVANLQVLQTRPDVVARFAQGYRETLDWMYADPKALEMYEEFSKVPERLMRTGRDTFFPKEAMWPDQVKGLERILADAREMRFISAPLTAQQTTEMIQIPPPPRR
jgi:NitT/TauT family transport system substrate-binding protein